MKKIKKNKWLRKCVYLWRNFEDRHSYTKGKGNVIKVGGVKVASRIQIVGNRNVVIIKNGGLLKNTLVKIKGNDNTIILGYDSFVSGAELWVEDNHCKLEIGDRTFVGHHSHLACTENNSEIIVGADVLISSYVQVRTGDSHAIFDIDGNRINRAKSVIIGNHCWIGEGAKVLKGVELGDEIVVASGSIVTKCFDHNALIGGVPAKVLKTDITWDSNR